MKSRESKDGARSATPTTSVALRLGLSALLLLHLVAGFVPGPLLWGMNHLAYAPVAARIVWPLLGLLLIWSPIGARVGRFLLSAEPGILGRRLIAYVLVPVLGAILFWIFRNPTHFLGDGWLLGEMVAAGSPFSGYEFMTFHLTSRLFDLLRLAGTAAAYNLFAVESVVAGAIYLGLAAWAARSLGRERLDRILLYGLLVFFAPLEMFFGYVECYSLLAAALLWFIVALVRYCRETLPARMPALAFAVALFLHLDALFFAPLLLLVMIRPPAHDRRSFPRRFVTMVVPGAVAFVLGGVIYVLGGYDISWLEAEFIGAHRLVKPFVDLTGPHGLFGLRHLKDWLNLVLLLAPVPAVLFIVAASMRGHSQAQASKPTLQPGRAASTLALGSAWLLLLMFVVNYKLGPVRDWDLFAAHSVIFVLAAWLVWAERPRLVAAQTLAAIIGTAFFLAVPWFWLNAGESRSFERFKEVITDLPAGTQAYAEEEIGRYLRNEDRIDDALAAYTASARLNPRNARVLSVLGALQYNSGRKDAALATFRQVLQVDSTFALAQETLARIYMERGDLRAALYYARKLAGRPEETAAAAAVHGRVAEGLGLTDEALAAYERASRLDPQRTDYLESGAGLMLATKDYQGAQRAFQRVLSSDPRSVSARVGLAIALWEPLRDRPADWAMPAARQQMSDALALIDSVRREGQDSEALRGWSAEIRAALGSQPR